MPLRRVGVDLAYRRDSVGDGEDRASANEEIGAQDRAVIEDSFHPLISPSDGTTTPRITEIARLFEGAGFKSPVLDNVRAEIWLKLWGNLSFNPLSALTHKTLAQICRFEPTRELARKLMEEAQTVAQSIGITFRVSIDKRIAGAERVGEHKTSMLQDVETGREPEIDALVGSVLEIARLQDIPTPHLDTVYVLVKSLSQTITKGGKRIQALAVA